MRVTVVGSQGMAGHVIVRYLHQQGHDVDAVDRKRLDVENPISAMDFFDNLHTDCVINAIGLLVSDSLARPDRAVVINSWWPHYAAFRLENTATRLVHLSTDCVFDGSTGPYREQDLHTETNAYGSSKSLGEINNAKDITMRMSIIGPELKQGSGLLNWVISSTESELPGWTNAYWNGITTLQLAKCIDKWIHDPKVTGIYHVVDNNVNTDKYSLLCEINEAYQLGKTIKKTVGPKSVNKILQDTRGEIDWQIPNYHSQLRELRTWYQTFTH
jgi:dTDP-4-dehydrorhamnose reductase